MDSSQRSMRRRIWSALLSASSQEIADGLSFYPGAHGLCRAFSYLYPELTPSHIAGIYAALSPMNTWDTNVANILDVLRDWSSASVNTTDANLHKALRIRCGEEPLSVLSGRKVRAFYHAIADPDDWSHPAAIDRHMMNLALGISAPTKEEQGRMAQDMELYRKIERVYVELGQREGLGNRLASIAWFVQRRRHRTGQLSHDLTPEEAQGPVCCSTPMWSHGHKPRRWYCPRCRSTSRPERCLRLIRTPKGWVQSLSTEGLKIWRDTKGRACVTLPVQHPYSNSAGYQRLARFLISEELGYLPHSMDHTHHKHGLGDDSLSSLALINVQYHGQIHASALFVGRGEDGRFRSLSAQEMDEVGVRDWPRHGAILGAQAVHEHEITGRAR